MPPYTIKMFLKFGQEEHIKDLYYNGTIFMNPIQYFRKMEDDDLRGDLYEGVKWIKNYPPGQIEIPKFGIKADYVAFQLRQSYETILGNILSLYCISSHGWEGDPCDFKIDERIKRFGSHCLYIKNNQKFLDLMESKLKELRVEYQHNFVEYYDKNKVNGEITIFEKPLEFEYQKEFRFYVQRFSDKPFIFNIGSLADIAEIYPSEEVVDTLELRIENKTSH